LFAKNLTSAVRTNSKRSLFEKRHLIVTAPESAEIKVKTHNEKKIDFIYATVDIDICLLALSAKKIKKNT
jgi:hypothetical protein